MNGNQKNLAQDDQAAQVKQFLHELDAADGKLDGTIDFTNQDTKKLLEEKFNDSQSQFNTTYRNYNDAAEKLRTSLRNFSQNVNPMSNIVTGATELDEAQSKSWDAFLEAKQQNDEVVAVKELSLTQTKLTYTDTAIDQALKDSPKNTTQMKAAFLKASGR